MEEYTNVASQEQEEMFSLKDYIKRCGVNWKWFVFSVFIICFLGGLYVVRQQPVYERKMQVLIKDQDGGSSADIGSMFSSLSLVSANTNVNNELISLTSPAVMSEVVHRLGLDVEYTAPGRFHERTLYGTNQPVKVKFLDVDPQESAGFSVDMNKDGSYRLYKFHDTEEGMTREYAKELTVKPGFEPISTPVGRIEFIPNGLFVAPTGRKAFNQFTVDKTPMQTCIGLFSKELTGDLADKDADVIDFTIDDVSIERATDILNSVVQIYNENWVQDKNKVTVATSRFIDDRLRLIEQELGNVDSDISDYKSQHLVPDLEAAAKLSMEQNLEVSNNILELTNKMQMAVYLRDYLKNPANAKNVIPVNTGIGSNQLEMQISAYNNLLLNRNTLASNSSDSNPLVLEYDEQLAGMRSSIVTGVEGAVVSLNRQLKNLQGAKGQVENTLAAGPTQAKHLLSVERQQKVMESLYLYLLQKREENELTQSYTVDNTRIITPPFGSFSPVAPKRVMMMGIFFVIGLLVPAIVIYIVQMTDTKVRSRKDLAQMTAPFAGEIPFIGKVNLKERFFKMFRRRKHGKELEQVLSVVKEGSRDMASESFRIVRGNIDFMIHNNMGANVIMLTSFHPGSGKSFIGFNLACSFALKGKRVLIVDADLRHGSLSQYVNMPGRGLSSYLTGSADDWHKLVVAVKDHEGVSVLPIGHRPPNPSELLDNGRLGEFLEEARKEYDYVFIDCPPVDVVVDTQIVERYVDRTIFVVRAGLLDRSSVAEVDTLYREKRFRRMCVVLNGTRSAYLQHRGAYGSYYYGNE